jgi:hypothetical protein
MTKRKRKRSEQCDRNNDEQQIKFTTKSRPARKTTGYQYKCSRLRLCHLAIIILLGYIFAPAIIIRKRLMPLPICHRHNPTKTIATINKILTYPDKSKVYRTIMELLHQYVLGVAGSKAIYDLIIMALQKEKLISLLEHPKLVQSVHLGAFATVVVSLPTIKDNYTKTTLSMNALATGKEWTLEDLNLKSPFGWKCPCSIESLFTDGYTLLGVSKMLVTAGIGTAALMDFIQELIRLLRVDAFYTLPWSVIAVTICFSFFMIVLWKMVEHNHRKAAINWHPIAKNLLNALCSVLETFPLFGSILITWVRQQFYEEDSASIWILTLYCALIINLVYQTFRFNKVIEIKHMLRPSDNTSLSMSTEQNPLSASYHTFSVLLAEVDITTDSMSGSPTNDETAYASCSCRHCKPYLDLISKTLAAGAKSFFGIATMLYFMCTKEKHLPNADVEVPEWAWGVAVCLITMMLSYFMSLFNYGTPPKRAAELISLLNT